MRSYNLKLFKPVITTFLMGNLKMTMNELKKIKKMSKIQISSNNPLRLSDGSASHRFACVHIIWEISRHVVFTSRYELPHTHTHTHETFHHYVQKCVAVYAETRAESRVEYIVIRKCVCTLIYTTRCAPETGWDFLRRRRRRKYYCARKPWYMWRVFVNVCVCARWASI